MSRRSFGLWSSWYMYNLPSEHLQFVIIIKHLSTSGYFTPETHYKPYTYVCVVQGPLPWTLGGE
jgi:hypothetical protein